VSLVRRSETLPPGSIPVGLTAVARLLRGRVAVTYVYRMRSAFVDSCGSGVFL
jgi:hypothetical protein